jgi:signal transduction histidine kinase
VKEIMEHHGGRVEVVSQIQTQDEAHGTVVTLWLPVAKQASPNKQAQVA